MTSSLPHPTPDAPFALLREMAEAPGLIRNFDAKIVAPWREILGKHSRLLVTGEGSSRIFPAKNLITLTRRRGLTLDIFTEGARQASEYNLEDCMVIGLSNSGRTRELVALTDQLKREDIAAYAVTATGGSPLTQSAASSIVLACGAEQAVAASKSVIEQALLLQALLEDDNQKLRDSVADQAEKILTALLPAGMAETLAKADTVYVAGRNDGVAEEIALKSCEITRLKSCYLEGTYVLHGIEEVMSANDCVILIEPFAEEIERYNAVLAKGVGLSVLAIASFATPFPTLRVPKQDGFDGYLCLMAGWRLLTAAALLRGIDIDKTERARKVGNAV